MLSTVFFRSFRLQRYSCTDCTSLPGRKDLKNTVDSKLNVMNSKLDSKFNEMNSKFKKMDSKFKKMDSKFKKMDSKLDELNKTIGLVLKHLNIIPYSPLVIKRLLLRTVAHESQDLLHSC